ncbi:uncharacterized protein VP01_7989g1 [Puccinia sorghi]|uniref:Retrotransposon gag domain-containing protein n=1 Tax=Puccinia sorghi TaxID=27349 RepID=A0A0L6UCS1_9BASI|nr:uncharacterized protein VP01_7989g1 [Puccinia sorghi]
MEALNACLDEMMCMLAKERTQQLATKETLRQNQAHLYAAVGQQNYQNPAPSQTSTSTCTASNPTSIVLAKPQAFNGTQSALTELFIGQIGLHEITYPECFPNNSSKVAFAISFMTDYAATWSQ